MADITQHNEAGRHSLSIAGDLNIYAAASAKQELLQALAAVDQLQIDLSQVEDFDSSGVQLLLLLKREAGRQRKQLEFVAHSFVVREVIDLLNLGAQLGDPLVIPRHEEGTRS
jgi:anti-sigma B factor antagonist